MPGHGHPQKATARGQIPTYPQFCQKYHFSPCSTGHSRHTELARTLCGQTPDGKQADEGCSSLLVPPWKPAQKQLRFQILVFKEIIDMIDRPVLAHFPLFANPIAAAVGGQALETVRGFCP